MRKHLPLVCLSLLLMLAQVAQAYNVPKTVGGFVSGLATVGYTLYNPSTHAVAVARTTTGVAEIGTTGIYTVLMPGTDGTEYAIVWDDGLSHNAPDVLRDPALPTAAIKTQTDKIGTNAADSSNAVAAQATISTNLNATVASRSTYAGGNVIVGGYATNQDPATLVWNALLTTYATTGTFGVAFTSGVNQNLSQTLTGTGWTGTTINQVHQAAWGNGLGKWTIVGNLLTIYAPDNTTALKAFTLTPTPTAGSRQ